MGGPSPVPGILDIATAAPSSDNLDAWLIWLETLSPREIDLGLDRVREVLERLDLPRPRRVVSVAGTNGKGSTVAYLEALYAAAGERVACYTSPHVLHFNERMRVAGADLEDAAIVAAFRTVEAARHGIPLTYFEFGTLAALVAFATARAAVLVLEIGLGGRLDAVNALEPDGAVITNISLDHCDWLGHDVESIAREKAGVMRDGIPVVFAAREVPDSIVATARSLGAGLLLAGRDYVFSAGADNWDFALGDRPSRTLSLPSLAGAFQLDNAAGALALFMALEGPDTLPTSAISRALSTVTLPGRLQRLRGDRHWLLDVAHNPAAAAALAAELQRSMPQGKVVAVIGVLADKDLANLVKPLLPLVDTWIAVPAEGSRAMPVRQLADRIATLADAPCRIADSVAAGVQAATALTGRDDLIVVSGSFYTVGPAVAQLEPVTGLPLGYTPGANHRD